jgi:hypothetical protein
MDRRGFDCDDASSSARRPANNDTALACDKGKRWRHAIAWLALCAMLALTAIGLARRMRHLWERPPRSNRADLWSYPFRTGDLLLTSTRWCDRQTPSMTKALTKSAYNHVAVAYVDPRTGQPLFWEMTQGGTRLASLHDLACGRPRHDIVVRPLNAPVDVRAFERAVSDLWDCVFDYDVGLAWFHRHRGDLWNLPVPFLRGHGWGRNAQRTCSHAAAELYAAVGVMDFARSGVDPASLFASDFGRVPVDRAVLPLANGYEFGDPVWLDFVELAEQPPPRLPPAGWDAHAGAGRASTEAKGGWGERDPESVCPSSLPPASRERGRGQLVAGQNGASSRRRVAYPPLSSRSPRPPLK